MMRSDRIMKLAMVAIAGLACSVAQAQTGDVIHTKAQKSTPQVNRGLRDGGVVNPIKVEIDGVEVPFELTEGSVGDAQAVLYENLQATNYALTPQRYRILDDFSFQGGQSARVTGIRPSFATPVAGSAFALVNVTVEVQFFGGFNPAVTPVNSPPSGNVVRVTYAFPAGVGWAANTVYTGGGYVVHGNGALGPVLSGGGFEVKVLNGATLAPHADISPALCGAGPTIGTSVDNVFVDLNNDGIYQGADAGAGNEATGAGAVAGFPGQANIRIGIQGQIAEASPTGACCLPDGSCVVLTQAKCLGLAGTYNSDGSTCASVAGHCATPPVLHNNGPLSTGPTALNGTACVAGSNFAEGAQEGTQPTATNGPNISGTFRIADDFTVPAGKQWVVNKFTIWSYLSGGTTTTSPVTGITLRIWNGAPNDPASTIVFGDTTTNLYNAGNASFSNLYRIFNSGLLAQAPTFTRPIWKFNVPLNVTLPAGTYWADWSVTGGPFAPQVTLMTNASNGVVNLPAANALQFVATAAPNPTGGWQPAAGNGGLTGATADFFEMPFILEGTESSVGGGCYANCDGSTSNPLLTANDFQCFLNKYASGDSYANCDGSTSNPLLTANDFQCFLNSYAAGCT